MKFQVTFKTPDAVADAIRAATQRAFEDSTETEPDAAYEAHERLKAELQEVTQKFVRYDECITIEFDSEKMTAKVLRTSGID